MFLGDRPWHKALRTTMTFELSEFFPPATVYQDGIFTQLGKADTDVARSLVYCQNLHYLSMAINNSSVSSMIVDASLKDALELSRDVGIVLSVAPRAEYWALHNELVASQSIVLKIGERQIGDNCIIHPTAVIGQNVRIADDVSIGPNAIIEDGTVIGQGTQIAAGVVIGAEGLQTYTLNGRKSLIRHAGGVRIGHNVAILANAVVSKAIYPDYTEIGDNTQISLLSSIGHQSRIGSDCSIAGNVLIGGSVVMGDGVWVGPSATIKDGLVIDANAQIKLGSVVVKDVGMDEVVSGNFAIPHKQNLRAHVRKTK